MEEGSQLPRSSTNPWYISTTWTSIWIGAQFASTSWCRSIPPYMDNMMRMGTHMGYNYSQSQQQYHVHCS